MQEIDMGGARVRRPFTCAGEQLKAGDNLTRDALLSLPIANRNALISGGYLDVYPQAPGETFIVRQSKSKFDVIRGTKLNSHPLTYAEAEALADRSA